MAGFGGLGIPDGFFPKPTPEQVREKLDTAADRLNKTPAQNLPGAMTGELTTPPMSVGGINFPSQEIPTPGFAVDLDGNGKYDRGQDAVLGIDSNKDGKLDQGEIVRTNAILEAHAGASADLNKDGKVDEAEKQRATSYRQQYAKLDKNHDGKLSNLELQLAGGQAWVDKNKDGKVDAGESQNLNKIETGTPDAPKRTRIAEVDTAGKSTIDQTKLAPKPKPWVPAPPAGSIPNHGPHAGPRPDSMNPPKPAPTPQGSPKPGHIDQPKAAPHTSPKPDHVDQPKAAPHSSPKPDHVDQPKAAPHTSPKPDHVDKPKAPTTHKTEHKIEHK